MLARYLPEDYNEDIENMITNITGTAHSAAVDTVSYYGIFFSAGLQLYRR